jgi:hypothetical protein
MNAIPVIFLDCNKAETLRKLAPQVQKFRSSLRKEEFWSEKPEGKTPPGRRGHKWEDDIKMDLKRVRLRGY